MQQRILVGISGFRGAGKDTAARYLIQNHNFRRLAFADTLYEESSSAFGSTVEHFGIRATKETPQKQLCLANCSDERFIKVVLKIIACRNLNRAYRKCNGDLTKIKIPGFKRRLKKFLHRPLSPRFIMQVWGTEYRRVLDGDDYWRKLVSQAIESEPHQNFVITDVRFKDEMNMISIRQGICARVTRPSVDVTDPTLMHSSEQDLLKQEFEFNLMNEEGPQGIENLYKQVERMLKTISGSSSNS